MNATETLEFAPRREERTGRGTDRALLTFGVTGKVSGMKELIR